MFFVVSKLAAIVITPSDAIAILGLVGVVLLAFGRRRAGTALASAAVLILVVCGWLPVGSALMMPLETRFPVPKLPDRVTGIVWLGGAVDPLLSSAHGRPEINEAAERLTATVELARRYPEARILLSGGIGRLSTNGSKSEAFWARRLIEGLGVAPGRISVDTTSRNTIQNAENSVRIAKPRPGETWLLVTSAYHMPRSVACFEKVGFDVLPYPVDDRTMRADLWQPTESVSAGLARTDVAVHEWIGLVAYHLAKGTALFPGPKG